MNDYVNNLDQLSHKRYLEKVTIINNIDPYNIKDWETDSDKLPAICHGDIVNYLVFGVSAYTLEEFRAYKSLEAFNQFACGWVKKIQMKQIGCYSVVLGQVMYSMRLSEKPLLPWIIASTDGVVKTAHCTCMAGLGEACSHVGALLFYIEDVVRKRYHLTVTDKFADWSIPSFNNVLPEKVENINFSLPLKKRKIDRSTTKKNHVPPLSKAEFDGFLKTLKDAGCDAPILRVQKDYEVKKSTLPSKEQRKRKKQ